MNNFIHQDLGPASIHQCIVTKVRPSRMSVDVYIPETASKFQNVNLLSQNLNTTYGSVALPEENSMGLVALYHRAHYPVFLGCIPGHGFNSGEENFECLSQGEQQLTAIGGGFIKLDKSGNLVAGSRDSAHQWLMNDGTAMQTSKKSILFSNLHRNNLRIAENNDIISLDGDFEYHESIKTERYRKEDFLVNHTIDWELEQKILQKTHDIIAKLDGESSIFSATEAMVSSIVPKRSCTESDIASYESFLRSTKLPVSGNTVKGEIFGDSALKIGVYDESDTLVAGINIDAKSGGKLIGDWEWWYADTR